MRRELLQLAETLNLDKHHVGGYFISEKLDGTRCFWDGGVSRGVPTDEVPWASILNPKTGVRKDKIKPLATGLWSRYGNPIIAPDWYLNSLPTCLLDGEAWAGRGNFQLCRSICGGDTPDPRFKQIRYVVYSAPRFQDVFASGEIKNANMRCELDLDRCKDWFTRQLNEFDGDFLFSPAENFQQEVLWMNSMLESQSDTVYMHRQEKLPLDEGKARERIEELLAKVLSQGGEGLVLRDPQARWTAKRNRGILKYKPYEDAEGTITGFVGGKETNKGSRLKGAIGALVLNYKGKRLELSGLTDDERALPYAMKEWATKNPGLDIPPDVGVRSLCFRVGQVVTFKFRELSDAGVPKEARYWRGRDIE